MGRHRLRRTRRRALAVLVGTLLASGASAGAWGVWTSSVGPGQYAAASAADVNAGATPTASVTGWRAVTVSWAGATLTNGQAVTGYVVRRYDAGSGVVQTILSNCTGVVAATSCVESSVPFGNWTYTVTPAIGTNWRGAESTASSTVTVASLAPVVTATAAALGYTENAAATAVDSGITVTDADTATLASATVTMTTNYDSGQDTLAFTNQSGITGSWNSGTGVLTLTGTATVAQYQTALRSITYANSSNAPSTGARTVTFVANDGFAASATASRQINVTAVNDAPAVTTTGGSLAYTENGAATALDSGVTVSDVDSTNLSSATVTMTTNYSSGQDTLAFTNQSGITGSWNSGTGALTLTGSATVAQYQTALSSVTYANSSNAPSTSARTVTFVVNDGALASSTASRTIAITAVNDAPAGTDKTLSVPQDTGYAFSAADFGFSDTTDGGADALAGVRMTSLVAAGTLRLNGTAVTLNQVVSAANISSGLLVFTPAAGATGAGYASFTFQVQDNGGTANGGVDLDPSANTMTITVYATYQAVILGTSGLVNYYRLGEAAGTTVVDSAPVSPNNGTYGGGITRGVAGRSGTDANTAIQFNGTDAFASVPRQIGDNFSIEFWFKSTQGVGTDPKWSQGAGMVDANITGTNDDFGVSLLADGRVAAGIGGGSAGSDMSVTSAAGKDDGNWHHVVFTRAKASGDFILYLDGTAVGNATSPNKTTLADVANIHFGRLASATPNWFAGTIDEVSLYDVVLTPAQVTAHRTAGL